MPRDIITIRRRGGIFFTTGGFTTSCAPSANFLARATGITSTTDKTNYDALICGLNSDGVLAKLDALYIFAAPDAATARLNLVQNAFNLTEHGTVTFSATHGFTSDGSTGYEDTGFTPSTAGGQYTQNSAHMSFWATPAIPAGNQIPISVDDLTQRATMLTNSSGWSVILNDRTSLPLLPGAGNKHYLFTRTAAAVRTLYADGVNQGGDTPASIGLPTLPFFILAQNDNGTADGFTNIQIGGASIGGGITATDAANFSTRMHTFMTAYGN